MTSSRLALLLSAVLGAALGSLPGRATADGLSPGGSVPPGLRGVPPPPPPPPPARKPPPDLRYAPGSSTPEGGDPPSPDPSSGEPLPPPEPPAEPPPIPDGTGTGSPAATEPREAKSPAWDWTIWLRLHEEALARTGRRATTRVERVFAVGRAGPDALSDDAFASLAPEAEARLRETVHAGPAADPVRFARAAFLLARTAPDAPRTEALLALAESRTTQDLRVRVAATLALGHRARFEAGHGREEGVAGVVLSLRALLASTKAPEVVREAAALALGIRGADDPAAGEDVAHLVRVVVDREQPDRVRAASLAALGLIPATSADKATIAAIETLLDAERVPSAAIRAAAAHALGSRAGTRALPRLVQLARETAVRDPAVARAALLSLERVALESDRATADLVATVLAGAVVEDEGDETVRGLAAATLARLAVAALATGREPPADVSATVERLVHTVRDGSPRERVLAAVGLGAVLRADARRETPALDRRTVTVARAALEAEARSGRPEAGYGLGLALARGTPFPEGLIAWQEARGAVRRADPVGEALDARLRAIAADALPDLLPLLP